MLSDMFSWIFYYLDSLMDVWFNISGYFKEFFIYLDLWIVKAKLKFMLVSIKITYQVASTLLNEIGFTTLFQQLFNMLPSELRYWGVQFGLPKAVTFYMNCVATSLIMRLTR